MRAVGELVRSTTGQMDGQAAAALSARAPAAAGAHDRRHDRLFMRASPDVAVRVRRGHLRAGADRAVQSARRAGAGALTRGLILLAPRGRPGNGCAPGPWQPAPCVQAVDIKQQNPPPPAPPLPPPRPQTGEPIKLPSPTTPRPVTVINANVDPNGPDDPQKHRWGPAQIGKDTTIAVGGASGIATGIAGEIPTLGAATAAIVAGAGALWDGMDKLGECK